MKYPYKINGLTFFSSRKAMNITEKLSVPLFTEVLHPVSCVADPTQPVTADWVHIEFQLNCYKNPAGFPQKVITMYANAWWKDINEHTR